MVGVVGVVRGGSGSSTGLPHLVRDGGDVEGLAEHRGEALRDVDVVVVTFRSPSPPPGHVPSIGTDGGEREGRRARTWARRDLNPHILTDTGT